MTSPPPPHAVVATLQLGDPAGPCVAIKDTLDIAGWPTRAGSAALADAPPASAHAEAVQRLLDAGWQVVAKTTLHELAFGTTGINHHAGTARNPGWPDRVPGGSSSGSAAVVAAGWVPVAIGTDTGGSVRVPAACCNVFGFKPTFGRVSRRGVMPAHSTLDCVGPFAADMASLVGAMQALDPHFGALPTLPDTLTLGLLDVRADTATLDAVRGALQRSGQTVHAVVAPLFDTAYRAGLAVINRETSAACVPLLATGRVGADVAARLARAALTTDAELAEAEAVRRAFSAEIDALLTQCDVLALPTLPSPPPRLADAADTAAAVAMTSLVRPFNLSGHPALSLPLLDAAGLPVGLQLVARHGDDARLCAIGARLAATLNLNACTGVRA